MKAIVVLLFALLLAGCLADSSTSAAPGLVGPTPTPSQSPTPTPTPVPLPAACADSPECVAVCGMNFPAAHPDDIESEACYPQGFGEPGSRHCDNLLEDNDELIQDFEACVALRTDQVLHPTSNVNELCRTRSTCVFRCDTHINTTTTLAIVRNCASEGNYSSTTCMRRVAANLVKIFRHASCMNSPFVDIQQFPF